MTGLLLGLTGLLLATCFGFPAIRAWVKTIDLRVLVLLHVSRLIGFVFLVLYRQGRLPYALAVPGGWSEIIVAAAALGLVFLPLRASLHRRACVIWNTFGLVEILVLVATALRLGFAQPWPLLAVRLLPCSMFPTFLVPLIIATHVIIYVRLSAPTDIASPPADQPADA